ncbi:MAG: hypothetical protein RLZZ405_153 [Verrucomicrobiota bacterium]|jgi:PST family polysaccharide transporter
MPFARILRSSALMGGAQVVVLAAGFVRAKAIALLLGASGVGLIGILGAFSGNIAALAGWGLGTAGVRLIAGAPDEARRAKVAAVRRMGWVLSGLGLLLALLTCWPVGAWTFDSSRFTLEMAIVALAVPCVIASTAWSAVLQASGNIASLAKVQVAGALAGLLVGLPAIYLWGTVGVAGSVFLAAAVPAFVLWRAARSQGPAAPPSVDPDDLRQLVRLGGALMLVGWLAQLAAYGTRLIIVRHAGLDAAGYYQAAFAIAGALPGFVFAAMGTDFFPRVAAAKDEAEAADISDRQIQAGLLLALPFLVGTLTLDRLCVGLLYAEGFEQALPLLPWMVWGVFFRLLAWPQGYCLLARGAARTVVVVEVVGNLLAVLLPLGLVPAFGTKGAAQAFFLSYALYALIMLVMSRVRSGRWVSAATVLAAAVGAGVLALAQLSVSVTGGLYGGLWPTALVAAGCLWTYGRALRKP